MLTLARQLPVTPRGGGQLTSPSMQSAAARSEAQAPAAPATLLWLSFLSSQQHTRPAPRPPLSLCCPQAQHGAKALQPTQFCRRFRLPPSSRHGKTLGLPPSSPLTTGGYCRASPHTRCLFACQAHSSLAVTGDTTGRWTANVTIYANGRRSQLSPGSSRASYLAPALMSHHTTRGQLPGRLFTLLAALIRLSTGLRR